ncbi:MAG: hypothetical protein PHV85_01790 [Desulfovibrionaceae bacterium]|nr:hypothetical protein [Desulfovibrionaceae bacterium]MDD4951258.1 hypothetical protein [Desulfovibrionaceae bacterium]
MVGELIHGMMDSTGPGMVGVSLIFIYLAWIVTIGVYRVQQGKKEGHH